MTAAATAHRELHAVQPTLAGIPDAPHVPEIRSSRVGQLQRHAEVRITPDGEHAHLVVQIVQPRHGGVEGLPFVCVYSVHHGDVVALEARAALMTTGSLVLVMYRGLDFDPHARTLVCLIEVPDLDQPQSPALRWLLVFHAGAEPVHCALPTGRWGLVLDSQSALVLQQPAWGSAPLFNDSLTVPARTVLGLVQLPDVTPGLSAPCRP